MKKFFIYALTFLSLAFPAVSAAENLIPYLDGKGKWGYCDKKSNIKIKPQYDAAQPFNGDIGIVFKNPYTIFISTDGREIAKTAGRTCGKWTASAFRHKYADYGAMPAWTDS